MIWRPSQPESRRRHLELYDSAEVEQYDSWVSKLSLEDDRACLSDIQSEFTFRPKMSVLDVGAGTGGMCRVLSRAVSLDPALSITALEPSTIMTDKLRSKPELQNIKVVHGFTDAIDDRQHFCEATFDVIISRQLTNGLYDPLTAFQNWYYWLKPGGTVIVLDGFYERSAWAGKLATEVDSLPLSACQNMAITPYLLELAGFTVETVKRMEATNALPSTRTKRYMIVSHRD